MPEPTQPPRTFTKAILEFFGKKPGQSMQELATEIKQLTPDDKAYLTAEFVKMGWPITG